MTQEALITSAFSAEIDATQALGLDGKGWLHLVPAGAFTLRDGRGPLNLADAGLVIANTRKLLGNVQMVVDYDHQSQYGAKDGVGGTAKAAGWITEFEARPDGIWGRVEWTPAAVEHLKQREYRYLSPVLMHRKDGRVMAIQNTTLTNSPAIDLLKAVASLEHTNMKTQPSAERLTIVATALGLAADADVAAVRTAFAATFGGGDGQAPDPAQFVPMAVYQTTVAEMNKLRSGMTKTAATSHVEEHIKSGRIAPFMKDWAVNLCTVNMPAFDAFVANVGPAFNHIVTPHLGRRGAPENLGSALSETEKAVCANLGLTETEFKARGRATKAE